MAPHAEVDMCITGVTDTTSAVIPDPVLSKNPTRARFSVEDVLPHRARSKPMPPGVAAFSSADMFKSERSQGKPKAKDFAYRLSLESKSRKPSSLKDAMKYFSPETISLCGGLPSSAYFPFESLSFKVPQSPCFSESETADSGVSLIGRKHDVAEQKSVFDLSIALNYGQSMGPPQLMRFFTEHTEIVHEPRYADWDITITVGSTSALDTSLRMFCTRGDSILMEEYTFSSAVETCLPLGLKPLGIKMDDQGLLPEHLDTVLSSWDESKRGRKPFVLYTIPTGQNPTSATQSLQRRKDIYAVAERHDLIILEDEPYYFLQMDPYVPGHTHQLQKPFEPTALSTFLDDVVPSYLSLDTVGRVIRFDSLSKTISPAARCGFVTAPKQIIERFVRHQEVSTQTPSGFTAMALFKLLDEHWGHKGFFDWLMFIRAEYTRRRDVIVNACRDFIPSEVATFTAPAAGMFHWIKVDARRHRAFAAPSDSAAAATAAAVDHKAALTEIEDKIFLAAVQKHVLVAKGSWFKAEKDNAMIDTADAIVDAASPNKTATVSGNHGEKYLYFRMTFAAESEEKMIEAVRRFGDALRTEFDLPALTH